MLLCVAVSMRWISTRFDAIYIFLCTLYFKQYLVFILAIYLIIIKIGSTTIFFLQFFKRWRGKIIKNWDKIKDLFAMYT